MIANFVGIVLAQRASLLRGPYQVIGAAFPIKGGIPL